MASNLKVGAQQLLAMRNRAESMLSRAGKVKAKAEAAVHGLVRSAEVGTSAFALGVVQGRYGPVEVLGVPVDLGIAVAGHLVGFAGLAGNASAHVHAFADGALATYAATLGRGTGASWREKALNPGKTSVRGELPGNAPAPGQSLPQEELDRLAQPS
jgi:hypothetical protein